MTAHLKHPADCIEDPSVRVDLLLVLLLDDENDLHRDEVVGITALGNNELQGGIDRKLGGILCMSSVSKNTY
jgi:hypothetical protein